MPYLVLVLGAFLSICGTLSIYFGYGIVQVERGWTCVIAGATALSGGVVTMALGLVIKCLLDLRTAVEGRASSAAIEPGFATAEGSTEAAHDDLDTLAPRTEPASLMTPELESGMLAAILSSHDDETALETVKPRSESRPHIDNLLQRREASMETRALSEALPAEEAPPPPAKPRFKVNVKPPAPPPPEPVPLAEPEAPAMDDWLDRAFSALDDVQPPPPREAPGPPPHPAEHEMAHADETSAALYEEPAHPEPVHPESTYQEPAHHEATRPETDAYDPAYDSPVAEDASVKWQEPAPLPPPTAAVIGRYEADGTSYVMYADGSIEAQSEAGIYRFKSMAELKTFIETSA